MSLVTIVLAAGMSRRMGEVNKLILDLDGKPVVVRTVDALLRAGLKDVNVVVGHDAAAVRAALRDADVSIVYNPDFASGIGSSVAAGISAVADGAAGIMVCLGDLPWLDAIDVRRVSDTYEQLGGRSIVRPCYSGTYGHPVALPTTLRRALAQLRGDRGAQDLIAAGVAPVVDVQAAGPGVLRDVDAFDDFQA